MRRRGPKEQDLQNQRAELQKQLDADKGGKDPEGEAPPQIQPRTLWTEEEIDKATREAKEYPNKIDELAKMLRQLRSQPNPPDGSTVRVPDGDHDMDLCDQALDQANVEMSQEDRDKFKRALQALHEPPATRRRTTGKTAGEQRG